MHQLGSCHDPWCYGQVPLKMDYNTLPSEFPLMLHFLILFHVCLFVVFVSVESCNKP